MVRLDIPINMAEREIDIVHRLAIERSLLVPATTLTRCHILLRKVDQPTETI